MSQGVYLITCNIFSTGFLFIARMCNITLLVAAYVRLYTKKKERKQMKRATAWLVTARELAAFLASLTMSPPPTHTQQQNESQSSPPNKLASLLTSLLSHGQFRIAPLIWQSERESHSLNIKQLSHDTAEQKEVSDDRGRGYRKEMPSLCASRPPISAHSLQQGKGGWTAALFTGSNIANTQQADTLLLVVVMHVYCLSSSPNVTTHSPQCLVP